MNVIGATSHRGLDSNGIPSPPEIPVAPLPALPGSPRTRPGTGLPTKNALRGGRFPWPGANGPVLPRRSKRLLAVGGFAVAGDVEAFALFFFGHAQADQHVDQLERDVGNDS